MAQPKFTPGPWVVGNADDFTMPRHGTMLVVRDGDVTGFVLAACGRPENMKAQANARLIAAAPDLYAALVDVIAWRGASGTSEEFLPIEIRAAWMRARGALAKAEGRDGT